MKSVRTPLAPILTVVVFLAAPASYAERADREKPINIEANRITVDETKKVQVFEGDVQLSQGTMMLRAERLVVSQDASGYQKGTAYGSGNRLASFRQKREGREEYVEGEAERIEHDAKAEKTELFVRARIKSGLDEVNGQYISYDARSENYIVSGAAPGTDRVPAGEPGRVRAVIQPKNQGTEKPASPH